jgi:hypothetical protein
VIVLEQRCRQTLEGSWTVGERDGVPFAYTRPSPGRYRPRKVDGEQGYTGPFTKDVEYRTCSVIVSAGSGCTKTVEFSQP